MSNVVELPSAAQSYLELRQNAAFGRSGGWVVEIVTPVDGRSPLRTRLAKADIYSTALNFARQAAKEKRRRLKHPDGWDGAGFDDGGEAA